ncbi:MAG: LPS-assembly protein LptD [Leucothrix sp.]
MNKNNLWIVIGSFFPIALQAYTELPVCLAPKETQLAKTITQSPTLNAIYVEADGGSLNRQGLSELEGGVIIQRNQQRLNADKASFDSKKNQVKASGNVLLSTDTTSFSSDSIDYDLVNQRGIINNAQYQVKGSHINGRSSRIEQKSRDELALADATYTTCPALDPSWHIASGEININQATQVGTAKKVTLRVADIPIFYFPWISFPLNNPFTGKTKRKTGFLLPEIGVTDQSGYEITIPYYFNLAPNYDATVYVTPLSERGLRVKTIGRFMTAKSRGELDYSFIPSDNALNDEYRDYFKLSYQRNLGKRRTLTIKAEGVSDDEYLDDLSDSLSISSTSALERTIRYDVGSKNWDFSLTALDYQVLDANAQPYAKLPELTFNYQSPHQYNGLDLSLNAEATYFEGSANPTGLRLDVGLKASKRFGNDAWYFKPTVSYQATQYSLQNNATGNSIGRGLPTVTLDSGLFFERNLSSSLTQTLEPRLFYTLTPYKDQSDIPIFDSARTDFSTSNQLFEANRFTGKDRIADANQLTLALTSRIQNTKTGNELFKASVGQIFYFDDRQVTLPGDNPLTDKSSEFAFELSTHLNKNTRFATTAFWDPNTSDWASTEARINYLDDKKRILNINYQHIPSQVSEIDTSFSLPITKKWGLIGKLDYDLSNDRVLEQLAGIEFEDCCLASRLVARRYLTTDNVSYDDALFFEFNLKGLGSISTGVNAILKENIYGYE